MEERDAPSGALDRFERALVDASQTAALAKMGGVGATDSGPDDHGTITCPVEPPVAKCRTVPPQ
jgi:hypothetical protein